MSEIRTDTINNASGDNDSGIDLSTNDQVKIKTANTTAVTVDASQNVIVSSNEPTLFLKDSNNANTTRYIKNSSEIFTIGRINDDLSASSVEHLRIDDSGRLLVGTSSAIAGSNAVIHINADSVVTGAGSILSECSGTGTVYHVHFRNGNGGVGGINTSGTSTSYVTSSDHRLKENVVTNWDATTRLKQLNPVRFNFIADADTTVDGFLAHEVQSVVPEAISGTHNEVDADGNPVYQGIDQSKLVPLLVKTIQELEARITALENA